MTGWQVGTLLMVLGLLPAQEPPDAPPSLETVLKRHLEAHGGAESWGKIRSLKIQGTWTAFSEDVPMTILRMRPDLYRFDHLLFSAPATLAFDGEKPWARSALLGAPEGKEITESWKENIVQDAGFGCLLLRHADRKAAIELAGTERLEGEVVHVLKVEPQGGPEETWYLDAGTFLETKRVSRTFDVFSGGIQVEMETYFSDFREVGGVRIPYREERHFGIRYHVYEAATVEVNPETDPAAFRLPEKAGEQEEASPPGEHG